MAHKLQKTYKVFPNEAMRTADQYLEGFFKKIFLNHSNIVIDQFMFIRKEFTYPSFQVMINDRVEKSRKAMGKLEFINYFGCVRTLRCNDCFIFIFIKNPCDLMKRK